MEKQSLKERVSGQKVQLEELAKAVETNENCGRDSEFPTPQHAPSPLNWQKGWDKGWNNYGKT